MKRLPLRIGVSVRLMHPDAKREILPKKTIEYAEASVPEWLMGGGALAYLIPASGRAPKRSERSATQAFEPVGQLRRETIVGRSNRLEGSRSGSLQGFREPASTPSITLAAYARDLDGLVLQGGADIAPETYGETPLRPEWAGDAIRDRYELALVEAFLAADKPILGICRGCQLLNVAFGGTLYQDISTQLTGSKVHRDLVRYDQLEHSVKILPQSRLAKLYPSAVRAARINSIHHQSIKDLGDGLVVEAVSHPDRIVEAVRLKGTHYVQGIQWHPEFVAEGRRGLLASAPLLNDFFAACRRKRRARM